jgi:glucose/arabinose dehydrogenase
MSPANPIRVTAVLLCAAALVGCARGPRLLADKDRVTLDRRVVEYPADLVLTAYAAGMTAPSAMAFVGGETEYKNALLIAESGVGGDDPQIYGFKPDGTQFYVYPRGTTLPLLRQGFRIYGPVGGMAVSADEKIYVSHRDDSGRGVITAFDFDGNHRTVVADLPANGDYGVTDVAVHPSNGRLYFGLGAATNSGVVGLDNWEAGWVDANREFCDSPRGPIKLNGFQFRTSNPRGGLFGGDDIVVTGPFQAFGALGKLRIPGSGVNKPTAAVYSISPEGGDLRVEAHGIRLPRGLVFNEFGNLFVSNNGMELRGTRPVKDDHDAIVRVPLGGQVWYGWPDYSADLEPIGQEKYQPPQEMIIRTGYPELAVIIDQEGSGLVPPDRNALLHAVFPALSGAAKMAFIGDTAGDEFKPFRGNVIVALSGDRAPFATGGRPLVGPQGFKVMRVDLDSKQTSDFVYNTRRMPLSMTPKAGDALERPIDVKIGPDGALYVLDFGQLEVKNGRERVKAKTGRVFRLGKQPPPATQPTKAKRDDKGHSPL